MKAVALRLVGLAYAAAIGYALWAFWPDARKEVASLIGGEYRHFVAVIYVFAGLWIAEKIWEVVIPRLGGEGSGH